MSAQQTHPRRRPYKASSPQPSHLSTHGMQLRKCGTYSSPKSISSDVCDLENHPYMPRRSPTSTESLEELIQDSSVQRVANLLKDFDKKIAGHKASPTNILSDPEVLPLPSFIIDSSSMESGPMEIDSKSPSVVRRSHDHASDSGLGSSVNDSKYGDHAPRRSITRASVTASVASSHSAITRSFSALGASDEKHTLGEYACKQIHDHIIKPILAEDSLKDFHPLIKDVPRRIGEKNICNLRDLEKTLIFLAPELSATPKSYQRFCERSIQLLHATVDHLSEQDQRLPTDRPYTNNYFLDLVEQIRRYAAIMAATRQKEAKGEELDEMDYSSNEKLTLRGGLSHNGRPAVLVREKEGKVLPLVDNAEEHLQGFSPPKRPLSDDDDDNEGIQRSMARRRKSDKPGDVMHVCRDCKKEFKRPCDLTKHEKTHSRPWKCTIAKCKYYDLGWPTEKERDRHVNDKHSSAPPQYKCHYHPCTYASKRESNCKQHMEKAHGWEYVRSKSNGRKKLATPGSERTPPTPLTPYPGTPMSALPTPVTPLLPSPSVPAMGDFSYPYEFGTPALSNVSGGYAEDLRRGSGATDSTALTFPSTHSPLERPLFDDAFSPDEPLLNHNDILLCGSLGNQQQPFLQQPTPALSNTAYENFDAFTLPLNNPVPDNIPHLSPGAQPDVTLFSPHMHIDEGFNEAMPPFDTTSGDFTLFDNMPMSNIGLNATSDFFPDLNQFGGQFDNPYMEPTMTNPFDELMNGPFNNRS
ncbi:hypothetical protein BU24DRAFT_424113 [Aaosphaeria arxii CBS 175.79]|uniref:C2H2-type domain-containing protein n=1 Tax=Aaosphaeria arxii CBS 175.79 TaxID=1450172 RepID=A0A6A5XLE3_9PLEO|nr:uncharacterized protein BU24DRAFT_424113 [Aaosphaeria arxii CBS 175.79]KAF2013114.1 hypothetical protein BU24DRAFT_424113 [Aaosphaeria arxii CBS 175.79]